MDSGHFYFIEVNPRVQVEHTVTEKITGIDIVQAQIKIAEGETLAQATGVSRQQDVKLNGHALQCRVTTEDPQYNFIPVDAAIDAFSGGTSQPCLGSIVEALARSDRDMPGIISAMSGFVHQTVKVGDPLLSIEAMKMETSLNAHRDSVIVAMHVSSGMQVDANDLLVEIV